MWIRSNTPFLLVPVKLRLRMLKAITKLTLRRGRAKRLLCRTWIFPLRRNLKPLHTEPHIYGPAHRRKQSKIACILIVPAFNHRSYALTATKVRRYHRPIVLASTLLGGY